MRTRTGVRLAVVIGLLCAGVGARGALIQSIITDKPQYNFGEVVKITITETNTAAQPVTMQFPSTLQAAYWLDDSYAFPLNGLQIPTEVIVPANGSYSWEFDHHAGDYLLVAGPHYVKALVVGDLQLPQANFVVVPEPACAALVVLGGLGMTLRRRPRETSSPTTSAKPAAPRPRAHARPGTS
jgi:hypothetical protein